MRRPLLIAFFLAVAVADLVLTWQVFDLPCPCACAKTLQLQRAWNESQCYAAELDRLASELVEQRLSLPGAAAELDQFLQDHHRDPLAVLGSRFEGLSDEARFALVLYRRVASNRGDQPSASPERLIELERQFEAHYQVALPPNARGEDSGQLR